MQRFVTIGIAVLVILSLFYWATPVASANDMPTQIAPVSGYFGSAPATDGQFVVWVERSDDIEKGADVYGVALADGQPFLVAGGPGNQEFPAIDDGIVVWVEEEEGGCPTCRNIEGKNLVTDERFAIGVTDTAQPAPSISGNRVIWLESDGTILMRDLRTDSEPTVLVGPAEGEWQRQGPIISADRVAWTETRLGPSGGLRTLDWQLFTLQIDGADTPRKIAEDESVYGDLIAFDLAGDILTYSTRGVTTLMAVNLQSGVQQMIAEVTGPADTPVISATNGRYIFWLSSVSSGEPSDILGYDLATDSRFVAFSGGVNTGLDIGGVLAWLHGSDDSSTGRQIYAAEIGSLLPAASRLEPGTTSPDWTYFAETGHYLAFGFKIFWEQSGELPVFGYPLTEEFSEHGLTVQYFERQRFEYHPEHAGTPYETELGRLGYESAARQRLLDDTPFQPLPDDTQSDAGCDFFPETGHRVCFGFKRYWQTHGLEFGDPDISFRESLALFGYPISEEFTDPESGLTVQYFERARFEYHPDNPEPSRVLLGRLGADLLAERGW